MGDDDERKYPKSNKQFYAAASKLGQSGLVLLHQCPKDKHFDISKIFKIFVNLNLQSKIPNCGLLFQEEALLISDKNKVVERIAAKRAKTS